MKILFPCLLAALSMISCKYDANGTDLASLRGTSWVLEDLGGLGVTDRAETTLVIGDDNRISGYGGCNRWFSSYRIADGRLSIEPISATKRMCPPEMMDQEQRFFAALTQVQKVTRDASGRLLIYTTRYQLPLVFRPRTGG